MAGPSYDKLGRPARPMRYPKTILSKVSEDALETLDEMAKVKGIKRAKVIRRAVMKDIYIFKSEKKRRALKELEADDEE